MLWTLLGVALALAALSVLAVLALGLWQQLKGLLHAVTAAGETIASATDGLAAAQSAAQPGGGQSPEHSRSRGL